MRHGVRGPLEEVSRTHPCAPPSEGEQVSEQETEGQKHIGREREIERERTSEARGS